MGDLFLQYDNTPMHTTLVLQHFLSMTIVSHSPHLPHLAPCDFFLFSPVKRELRGKRFADVGLKGVLNKKMQAQKTQVEDFQNCLEK